jgi:hypothetical protein
VGLVVVAVVTVVVVGTTVVLVVVVDVDVRVDVDVDVVDLAQDAKTKDATMRPVSIIQAIPLFIQASLFLLKNLG